MFRLCLVEYLVWCVLGDSGFEELPSGRDEECCIVEGKGLVHGVDDVPEIVCQVGGVIIDEFQYEIEDLAH